MDPQNPIEPNNIPNAAEGGVMMEHTSQTPQPQIIQPSVIKPSMPNSSHNNFDNLQNAQQAKVVSQPQKVVSRPQPTAPQSPSFPTPVIEIGASETDGQENQQWRYNSGKLRTEYENDDYSYRTDTAQKDIQNAGIIWSASEFVSHQKNKRWYVLLAVSIIVVSGILYLVTREVFSIVVVIVLGTALGVFGAVKPKTLDYSVGDEGMQIGPKQFPYTAFHSFAVIDDAAIAYIQLLPQKRFMAPISIYFAPDDEKKIVDYLGKHLPLEHKKRDFTDRLASRIHF